MNRALSILKLMLTACLISSAALIVNAQAPGSNRGLASSGGTNMIQGGVHFPSGQTPSGKTIKVSLELKSTGPTAHYYLGLVMLSTKRYKEALPELELTISNGGENIPLAHKYLGGLYMSAQKNQQAADELEKYLQLDPKTPDADRIKGTIKDLRSKQ